MLNIQPLYALLILDLPIDFQLCPSRDSKNTIRRAGEILFIWKQAICVTLVSPLSYFKRNWMYVGLRTRKGDRKVFNVWKWTVKNTFNGFWEYCYNVKVNKIIIDVLVVALVISIKFRISGEFECYTML